MHATINTHFVLVAGVFCIEYTVCFLHVCMVAEAQLVHMNRNLGSFIWAMDLPTIPYYIHVYQLYMIISSICMCTTLNSSTSIVIADSPKPVHVP